MEIAPPNHSALDELKEYAFISYIRKKKTKQIMKSLFSGYSLFVPFNISLPMTMKRIDLCLALRFVITL